MKKILIILVFLLGSLLIFNSCEDTDPLSICEINHYGYVKLINNTDTNLYINVTKLGYNEIYLSRNSSYTYQTSSGSSQVLFTTRERKLNNLWWYDYVDVYDCEISTYAIYNIHLQN